MPSFGHDLFPAGLVGVPYRLTFWGTRGSIPTPGPQTARYGGNTACISITGRSGHRIRVYGAAQEGVALEQILKRQMDPMVFPVPLEAVAAKIDVREIGEGDVGLEEIRARAFRLRHPGTTLGYRLEPADGGRDIA